jgi:hypothetical protein
VALDASQQTDVAVGDKVTITLPNNQTTPGCRLLGGDGRHLPIELRVGRVGSELRCAGNGHLLVGELGEQHPDHHRGRHPVRPGRHGHVGSGPGAGRYHHRQRAQRPGGAGDRAAGPVRRWLRRRGRRRRRSNHLVPVSLGLFDDADGLVQVTGSGLAAGQEVVVPST